MPFTSRPPDKGARRRYACSFCGKDQEQVQRLIAGPGGVYICNECVSLCQEIITEEHRGGTAMTEAHKVQLPTPTPCPQCQTERILAEAGNNVRVVEQHSGLRGAASAHSELWAIVCPNCGYTTFYAKNPDKLAK